MKKIKFLILSITLIAGITSRFIDYDDKNSYSENNFELSETLINKTTPLETGHGDSGSGDGDEQE